MVQLEDIFWKNFGISQKHLDFLERINSNTSLALRTVLDSIMRNEKKLFNKQEIDKMITYAAMGLICWLIAFLFTNAVIILVSMSIGSFLFGYGIIGWCWNVLQLKREKKG